MDKRKITSANNGKRGGRPISEATLRVQIMREELTKAVLAEFKEIYRPQIDKAKDGDFEAFKELMNRIGIRNKSNFSLNDINFPEEHND